MKLVVSTQLFTKNIFDIIIRLIICCIENVQYVLDMLHLNAYIYFINMVCHRA